MSRNKHNAVPQIKYDFNRVTDRRREARAIVSHEIFFRDATSVERASLSFSGKANDRN